MPGHAKWFLLPSNPTRITQNKDTALLPQAQINLVLIGGGGGGGGSYRCAFSDELSNVMTWCRPSCNLKRRSNDVYKRWTMQSGKASPLTSPHRTQPTINVLFFISPSLFNSSRCIVVKKTFVAVGTTEIVSSVRLERL